MLLTHAKVVTAGEPNEILADYAVKISGGTITDLGPSRDLMARYPLEQPDVLSGKMLMPGAICGHTHFYGAFARGMAVPGDPARDFPEILRNLWWKLDRALSLEDVYYSALVCMIDAIRHGTTTLIDHHASPCAIEGSLDKIADAAIASGIRTCTCYEVTDRNGPEGAAAGIEENIRFIRRVKQERHPLLGATFGLHASLTLSDETMARCVGKIDSGTGFHLHAAEGMADVEDSLEKSGRRVVHRLNEAGILGPRTILAHCVHIDESEMDVLKSAGVWVTHQPRSNMNNAVGVAPLEKMMQKGVRLAFGNDGFSNDMWVEWKTAYLLHKLWHNDPRRANGADIYRAGTSNTARLAELFWPDKPIGIIKKGAAADLMVVEYEPFTDLNTGNLPWHLLFGMDGANVTGTICNGLWLMKDRKILTLDESEISDRARELSRKTWQRLPD